MHLSYAVILVACSTAKTFYVTDRTPNLTLLVRNEFNCDEYIHLTCVTKSKLDLDRSTASSLGVTTFYDDKSAYEYDVESSMLTFEEAKHFSQLLLSRYVNIVEKGGALAPITITDINSEISDADNATNSIKFKYKYSSHHFQITIDYGNNIFDDLFITQDEESWIRAPYNYNLHIDYNDRINTNKHDNQQLDEI